MSDIDVRARIVRATVYEDRAELVREAEVTLPAGSALLVVRDLPAVLSDEHVVARLERIGEGAPAFVNDVRVDRRLVTSGPESAAEDDVAARTARLHAQAEALDDELKDAEDAMRRASAERTATETALRRWCEQMARAAGQGDGQTTSWSAGMDAFQARLRECDQKRAQARALVTEVKRRRARLLDAAPGKKPSGQKSVAELRVRVSGPGGAFRLVVSTLVPCAAWRPSHEAFLVDVKGTPRVRFVTAAAVWNATGEAWSGVDLVLSTARPSAGAELPPLRADRLTLRTKTAEERRTIVVEHRDEGVPKSALQGTAPGVDDGGEARVFTVKGAVIPSDGRPHRVPVASFDAPAAVARVAFPEVAPQVFLRASLKNAGAGPILAGPFTLVFDGAQVGTADVLYVGAGESFDLSFGSDDRFLVRTRRRRAEDKKLVGKDVVHFIREATLSQTGEGPETVVVHMRLPVSEVKQVKVLPSPQHSTIDVGGAAAPDEHGIVRVPVELVPNVEKKLVLAFSFDTSGEVRIPDPW